MACEICASACSSVARVQPKFSRTNPSPPGAEPSSVVEGDLCMFKEEMLGVPLDTAAATIDPHEIGRFRNREIKLRQPRLQKYSVRNLGSPSDDCKARQPNRHILCRLRALQHSQGH